MGRKPRKRGSARKVQTSALATAIDVAGFLRQRREAIVHSWEARVTSEVREVEQSGLALRDDIPELLDELAAWLASNAAPETALVATRALAHVMQRLDAGLPLAQLFREYRLLRETILEEVLGAETAEQERARADGEGRGISRIEELARLNAGLDVVLSQSVEQFVTERDRRAAEERAQAAQALRGAETRYQTLFDTLLEGFCIIEVLFDMAGKPVDYRFLEINAAFERQTGLKDARGRLMRELVPEHEAHWFEIYGSVAATGRPARFVNEARALGRWYDVSAYRIGRPESRSVAILFNDITDRIRSEVALEEANQQLREADERKNQFLAVLSHELRNPLTPIRNSTHILERAAPGGDQAKRALAVIDRQAGQLARLVDDLLDVTRITENKIRLQRQQLEVNELVRRTLEDQRSVFEKAEVHLEFVPAPVPVYVSADWSRLAQVVGNLLQNAVKFTGRGGETRVAIRTDAATRRAVIQVADTGVGMAPEMLSRLFKPFSQADSTLDRSKGGLGLGLALVKGLVELHGGDVTAHSAGLGKGAEFVVRLPLAMQEVTAPPKPGTDLAASRRRVLVIEDNIDGADSLREVLEFDEHEVEVAYNGPEGLAKARTFRPDIVLCDIGLPGMDGFEVARAFRADEALRGAFLVALSGYALAEDLRRAAEAGFERHLAKPPSLAKLEQLLAEVPGPSDGNARGSDASPPA